MSCPHSLRDGPCSVCLGAPAKRVELVDGAVVVDGQPHGRGVDPGMSPAQLRYSQRGRRGGRR